METLPNNQMALGKLSYENLDRLREEAIARADYDTLQVIAAEARSRDGLDDTDASYNYLANQCIADIEGVMIHYG